MALLGFGFAAKVNGFPEDALVLATQYNQATGLPSCSIDPIFQSGNAPYNAAFRGMGSPSFGRYIVSYEWDLDNNGSYNDAFGQSASRTYFQSTQVGLRVQD